MRKCNAAMEEGSWSITPPEEIGRSPSGSKANRKDHSGTALTFRARARFRLFTYRCAACGYLEFYARGKELGLIP
jgi:hypothetical protein